MIIENRGCPDNSALQNILSFIGSNQPVFYEKIWDRFNKHHNVNMSLLLLENRNRIKYFSEIGWRIKARG